MEQKTKINQLLVSICCITYNHESFIRKCLDGFIMQETNFSFEVLIHDDASTDKTAEIIGEYEAKYPNIIKPIYQTENQYSKGVKISATFNFPRSKGKYIAMCEGDDYWTNPLKLQKQVDFLEANQDYSMCFHNAFEVYEDNSKPSKIFSNIEDRDYTNTEVYRDWIIPTASVLFRRFIIDSNRYGKLGINKKFIYGDIILFLTCGEFGKLRGMSDCMSIYRRHNGGVTAYYSPEIIYKLCVHDLEIAKEFKNNDLSNVSRELIIRRSLSLYYNSFFKKKEFNFDIFKKMLYLLCVNFSLSDISILIKLIYLKYRSNK